MLITKELYMAYSPESSIGKFWVYSVLPVPTEIPPPGTLDS